MPRSRHHHPSRRRPAILPVQRPAGGGEYLEFDASLLWSAQFVDVPALTWGKGACCTVNVFRGASCANAATTMHVAVAHDFLQSILQKREPLVTVTECRRSMELMAKEVWPRIDRALQATTPKEQTGGKVCSD